MVASEFFVILLWLLAPALVLGWSLLLTIHWKGGPRMQFRFWRAVLMLTVGAMAMSIAMTAFGPTWIAVRDVQVLGWKTMWAPLGFVAVALVLPAALWLARAR